MDALRPAQWTPRQRAAARAGGTLLPHLLRKGQSRDELLTSLGQLADVCHDADVAIEVGQRGGHAWLARLLTQPSVLADEDCAAAVGHVIDVCTRALPSYAPFPLTLAHDAAVPPPLSTFPLLRLRARAEDDSELGVEVWGSVKFRAIPASMRRLKGQEDVGQLLWPAAPVLARWLTEHAHILCGRCVLEIGAGIGLAGLVAGLAGAHAAAHAAASARERGPCSATDRLRAEHACAPRLVLTDFNETVLGNLAYNAHINEPALHPDEHGFAALLPTIAPRPGIDEAARLPAEALTQPPALPLFHVAKLDWGAYAPPELLKRMEHESSSTGFATTVSTSGASADARLAPALPPADACGLLPATADDLSHIPILPPDMIFDLVIGSDMVCCKQDAWCVAATLQRHLRRRPSAHPSAASLEEDIFEDLSKLRTWEPEVHGGFAIIMLPPSTVRWGIRELPDAVASVGLRVHEHDLPAWAVSTASITQHMLPSSAPPAVVEHAQAVAAEHEHVTVGAIAGGYEALLRVCIISWL